MQNVVVTGLGVISALGESPEVLWHSIEDGKTGIKSVTRFDVKPFSTKIAALIARGDSFETEEERLVAYGCHAANEALINGKVSQKNNLALIVGTCNGLLGKDIHFVNNQIAKNLDIKGVRITFSTACASSTQSVGFAVDLIRQGVTDIALAGGVDILNQNIYAGFHSLGLLAANPCSPFSIPAGTTLGEGAAFILLESEDSAKQRRIKPVAHFVGYGFSADAYHDTKPDPSGMGMTRAIQMALNNASIDPMSIDYLNAHGTGTLANDSAEWRGIERVFKRYAEKLPISSSKSFLGHTQGASGAMESVITLLSMQHQAVPQTLSNGERPIKNNADFVFSKKPRPNKIKNVLSTNAGFGGVNAALVFSKSNGQSKKIKRTTNKIYIKGTGLVNNTESVPLTVPKTELRGTDTSTRLLAGAIANAIEKSGIRLRSPECEEIGLFVSQAYVSCESVNAFENSVKERGLSGLSAAAFTRMVVNFASGACCRIFGLKGPLTTMASGVDGGLSALVIAANHLAWYDHTNSIIAAAVDEPNDSDTFMQQAAGILLTKQNNDNTVFLSGWAMAKDSDTAISLALKQSKKECKDVILLNSLDETVSSGLQMLVKSAEKLRQGESGTYLLIGNENGTVATAVIIEREKH